MTYRRSAVSLMMFVDAVVQVVVVVAVVAAAMWRLARKKEGPER